MIEMASIDASDTLQDYFKSHNPLIAVLQSLKDGVMICDTQARILAYNRHLTQWLGVTDEALNQPCSEIIPDQTLTNAIQTILRTGEPLTEDIKLICGNVEKSFQIDVVPLTLPSEGTPESSSPIDGCVIIFQDMTALKKTEKMRRDFVANVSHELRTPLSAIKGYAETLLEGALEDKAVSKDFVKVIYKHSHRLSQLVADLLDLSKLESTDFQLELAPVKLFKIVDQVHSMAEGNIKKKNLVLQLAISEELPKVSANPSSLEQVLTNLLDNAIKYTPVNGTIKVSAFETRAGNIQVDVSDTGMGIDSKHIPRLFERFYRVDKARSRDLGGTGLGLSIVKHIIQLHGGELWVDSSPDKGTAFHFTLNKA